ncbi:prepilin-type N-terminal cleavage/methylation domain-containing protein [Lichenibacterium minor]|uniref:Prepilin-type N-terminal cleavage/methylation domain-containing protein n=1 Tax=Lichenibacterium minor TaxID=2316528 RepID=A0A4Q2U632_9HYPH|nr:prepilin-type N-terminal cleavage/methylation domain-containing protein [Lichenibacterium minor]RYC32069.1 prepilin-type N-terminal cleavage/methylation domain-containing protein [Lichenibacterium minor]
MSTSSRAGRGSRRGFTLVEALVALVVAGLVLPALARAMGGAWSATRAPMDVVSAIVLARDVAEGGAVPPDARGRGYAAERRDSAATVLVLASDVAPAPRDAGKGEDASDLHPEATPSAIRLAVPKGLGGPPPGAAPSVQLRRVSVSVRTPAGRRVTLDTVKVADAPN